MGRQAAPRASGTRRTRRASCHLMSPFWGHRFKLPSSPQPVDTAAGHIWEMGREDLTSGSASPQCSAGRRGTLTAARFRRELGFLQNPQGQESRVAGRAAGERDSLGTEWPCQVRALPAGVSPAARGRPLPRSGSGWPRGHPMRSAPSLKAPVGRI